MSESVTNSNDIHVAVVIPLYKSKGLIVKVLNGIPAFVRTIIVVDDCSPDDSFELANTVKDCRIIFVRHEKNQGVGGAVVSGYKKALELGAGIIVKMDCDDQMDPAYMIPLIAPLLARQADYSKGNRFIHAEELKSMPLIRRLGNSGLSILTKAASGYWGIFDSTNGYTAINASVLPILNLNKLSKRYFFETSMLIELGHARAVIEDVEVPARYEDEISSLSEINTLLEFPPLLTRAIIRRIYTQYFIRDFGIFSTLVLSGFMLGFFGMIFGVYHWYLSSVTKIPASTGTVMLAILPLILGSQMLIQALLVDIGNQPKKPISRQVELVAHYARLFDITNKR